jgi:hypothetical protein
VGSCCPHDDWFSNSNMDDCRAPVNRHFAKFFGFDEWDSLKGSGAIRKARLRVHLQSSP